MTDDTSKCTHYYLKTPPFQKLIPNYSQNNSINCWNPLIPDQIMDKTHSKAYPIARLIFVRGKHTQLKKRGN